MDIEEEWKRVGIVTVDADKQHGTSSLNYERLTNSTVECDMALLEENEEKVGRIRCRVQMRNIGKSKNEPNQENIIGGIVRHPTSPTNANNNTLTLFLPTHALFLVLALQATAGGVKHAALCLFLRYKEDDHSGWLSIFFSSLTHRARCSLFPLILLSLSLYFHRHALQSAPGLSVCSCGRGCARAVYS